MSFQFETSCKKPIAPLKPAATCHKRTLLPKSDSHTTMNQTSLLSCVSSKDKIIVSPCSSTLSSFNMLPLKSTFPPSPPLSAYLSPDKLLTTDTKQQQQDLFPILTTLDSESLIPPTQHDDALNTLLWQFPGVTPACNIKEPNVTHAYEADVLDMNMLDYDLCGFLPVSLCDVDPLESHSISPSLVCPTEATSQDSHSIWIPSIFETSQKDATMCGHDHVTQLDEEEEDEDEREDDLADEILKQLHAETRQEEEEEEEEEKSLVAEKEQPEHELVELSPSSDEDDDFSEVEEEEEQDSDYDYSKPKRSRHHRPSLPESHDKEAIILDEKEYQEYMARLPTTKRIRGRRHICPVPACGREFTRRFNLRTHMKTHDPHRTRPWACPHPGCHRTFVRSHDLERHSAVHNDVKPFHCDGCGIGFTRRDAMKRHMEKKGCGNLKLLHRMNKKRKYFSEDEE